MAEITPNCTVSFNRSKLHLVLIVLYLNSWRAINELKECIFTHRIENMFGSPPFPAGLQTQISCSAISVHQIASFLEMTGVAAATSSSRKAPAAEKKQKKPSVAKKVGPSTWDMIKDAISTLKERSGSSRQAILKHISVTYKLKVDTKFQSLINRVLKSNVQKGKLQQIGQSFKVPKKAEPKKLKAPKKKTDKKPKKAVTAKPTSVKESNVKAATKVKKTIDKKAKKPVNKKPVNKKPVNRKAAKVEKKPAE